MNEPSTDEKIYNALDKVERFLQKLAKINHIIRNRKKNLDKKNKRIYKLNKKTGVLVLKKSKKQKNAKPIKR